MKKASSAFLFSGKKGKIPKRANALAFKKMRRAKRKTAGKAKGCEFC